MNSILLQYGIAGVGLLALSGFIMYLMREHKKERAELVKKMEDMFKGQLDTNKDTNSVIKDNSNILTGLKTLFEISLKK